VTSKTERRLSKARTKIPKSEETPKNPARSGCKRIPHSRAVRVRRQNPPKAREFPSESTIRSKSASFPRPGTRNPACGRRGLEIQGRPQRRHTGPESPESRGGTGTPIDSQIKQSPAPKTPPNPAILRDHAGAPREIRRGFRRTHARAQQKREGAASSSTQRETSSQLGSPSPARCAPAGSSRPSPRAAGRWRAAPRRPSRAPRTARPSLRRRRLLLPDLHAQQADVVTDQPDPTPSDPNTRTNRQQRHTHARTSPSAAAAGSRCRHRGISHALPRPHLPVGPNSAVPPRCPRAIRVGREEGERRGSRRRGRGGI
jgi:hypothetical protein